MSKWKKGGSLRGGGAALRSLPSCLKISARFCRSSPTLNQIAFSVRRRKVVEVPARCLRRVGIAMTSVRAIGNRVFFSSCVVHFFLRLPFEDGRTRTPLQGESHASRSRVCNLEPPLATHVFFSRRRRRRGI